MRLLLSISYAKNKQIERGIEEMKTLLAEHKSDDYVGQYDYYVLGLLCFKNGQYIDAIKYLEKQLSIDPDLINSYYYLGLAQIATGNIKNARLQFEEAILRYGEKKSGYASQGLGYRLEEKNVSKELEMLTEM